MEKWEVTENIAYAFNKINFAEMKYSITKSLRGFLS